MNIAWIKYVDDKKYGKAVKVSDELLDSFDKEQLIQLILDTCNLLAVDYEITFTHEDRIKPVIFKIVSDEECEWI